MARIERVGEYQWTTYDDAAQVDCGMDNPASMSPHSSPEDALGKPYVLLLLSVYDAKRGHLDVEFHLSPEDARHLSKELPVLADQAEAGDTPCE